MALNTGTMLLKSLESLLRSESRARQYLAKKAWQGKSRFCVRCRSAKIYRLAEKRYRCGRCGYTFQDFSGRWIGRLNLKARQWLWTLKLFELEVPTLRIATEIGISYPTALKAVDLIRCAIALQNRPESTGEENRFDEHYFRCGSKGSRHRQPIGRTPVFGLMEGQGKVELSLAKHISADTLAKENIRAAKIGSVVYTDGFRGYDALLFWSKGSLNIEHTTPFREKLEIDRGEGFWSFAKERLDGISKQRFPIYLKELEFRYNRRNDDLSDLLVDYITQLVPNPC
ncbi:MAG: IS1595 family transposase [Candidatus Binatia bacterium]